MSEQELQFHYFKMHDSDGNNKLDGCELVKSLIHWHGESPKDFVFLTFCLPKPGQTTAWDGVRTKDGIYANLCYIYYIEM